MNKLLLLLTFSISTALTFSAAAQPKDMCATHTVRSGDTLRNIAETTYGSQRDYRYIYDANRTVLGLSPHSIRVGMVLDLPCARGLTNEAISVPAPVAEIQPTPVAIPQPKPVIIEVTEPTPTPEPAPLPVSPVVQEPAAAPVETAVTDVSNSTSTSLPHIETSSDFEGIQIVGFEGKPPYSDPELADGGLISKIVQTALLRGGATKVASPTFISSSALKSTTSVLPDAFQLSFPWLLPNCDLAMDNPDILDLCENYAFSAPVFEAQMAMFVLGDGPFANAKVQQDIAGARVCRPASANTYDLLDGGSLQPAIVLETAAEIASCFADLHNDIVDIVSVNGLTADMYYIGSDEQSSAVIELSGMTSNHTLHAITRKDDMIGNIALDQLNTGLWEMFSTGEWSTTAKSYLTEQLN